MAEQHVDDVSSRERVCEGLKGASDTVDAISSFVDGDDINDIMKMQQSV